MTIELCIPTSQTRCYFRGNMSTRDLGESDLPSHANFPEGLPENLVVRGTGEALAAGLDRLGEDCSTLTGAITLYFDSEQQLEGPQFVLRGPPIEFGVKPRTIWGDVSWKEFQTDNINSLLTGCQDSLGCAVSQCQRLGLPNHRGLPSDDPLEELGRDSGVLLQRWQESGENPGSERPQGSKARLLLQVRNKNINGF